MIAAGFTRPGLQCVRCGEAFSLFLARPDAKKVEELSDPFRAKCPLCGHEAIYPKSQIGTLAVVDDR
jgi:DNA-directed RNA polymerase subunit RPC12/RpoP